MTYFSVRFINKIKPARRQVVVNRATSQNSESKIYLGRLAWERGKNDSDIELKS
jgi:hypothetical protein